MPPANQNLYTPPTLGQAPPPQANYDFFLNPPKPPKQPLTKRFSAGSFQKKMLTVAACGIVLIILIVVISSLLGSGSNMTAFITTAQDQTELVRVATEANSQATVQNTKNLSQSIELSLTSAQQQTLNYLKTNGRVLSTGQLGATKNAQTDKELTAATAASNFNAVFAQVMQTGLKGYINDLKIANSSASPKGKTLLKSEFNSAELLLTQTNAAISSLQSQ
jgi:Na+-transporting methylmalonyl-CoA/oxaloacetate decarboxylase gamma subunit